MSTTVYAKKTIRSGQITLVQGDTRTQIITLIVARHDGGVDLAPLSWCVRVKNADGDSDVQLPTLVTVADSDIQLEWLVHGTATAVVGETQYMVEGVGTQENGDAMVWRSGVGSIVIADDLDADFSDEAESLDSLQQLIVLVQGDLENVIAAGNAAQEAADRANAAAERVENALSSDGSGAAFEIGSGLKLESGVLSVDAAEVVEQDNTLPVTSAAVYTQIGNIDALLQAI